jgi:hypothetical protein
MPSNANPGSSRFDDRRIVMQLIIHIQASHRCSTDRARSQNITAILAPLKMVSPLVNPRIEHRYLYLCQWIGGLDKIITIAITALTG